MTPNPTFNSLHCFSSLASTLPVEVVLMIGESLGEFQDPRDPVHKSCLATCSLVCRHWSKAIRPVLFSQLFLYTAQDVSQLLEFLGQPIPLNPLLSSCVKSVTYRILGTQVPPWIQINHLSRCIPESHVHLKVGDYRTSRDRHRTEGSSLLKSFPRTIPASMFRFSSIELYNIDFQSAREFASLFLNVTHLQAVRCASITVDHPVVPRTLMRRHRPKQPAVYGDWFLIECADISAGTKTFSAAFALVSSLTPPARYLKLDEDQWAGILEIVSKLVPSEDAQL